MKKTYAHLTSEATQKRAQAIFEHVVNQYMTFTPVWDRDENILQKQYTDYIADYSHEKELFQLLEDMDRYTDWDYVVELQ